MLSYGRQGASESAISAWQITVADSVYDLKRKAVGFAKFLTKRRGYQFYVASVTVVPGSSL